MFNDYFYCDDLLSFDMKTSSGLVDMGRKNGGYGINRRILHRFASSGFGFVECGMKIVVRSWLWSRRQ
jgi:hypothetical protein